MAHSAQPPDLRAVADGLVQLYDARAAAGDGRIRVEDLLSAASAVCGEACIAAVGEFDPEDHQFSPGSVVMSNRINDLLAADSSTWSEMGQSVFRLIHGGALANGYDEVEFPLPADVFQGFASSIATPDGPGWGFVPLSVPPENRPRIEPLRDAYELRSGVRAVFAAHAVPLAEWPMLCALAIVLELGRVRDAIDHGVALRLVLETVNGMAKTAPMTDAGMKAAGV